MTTLAQARAHNRAEFARMLRLPGQVSKGLTKTLTGFGQAQVADMRRRLSGRPGLISRTGGLRSSFAFNVTADERGPSMIAFTTGTAHRTRTLQPFSRVQEGVGVDDETIIKPRFARMLTVPTGLNVGASGLPKYASARDLRAAGLTRLIRTRSGKFFIMVKEGAEWRPMWVLKPFVRIPARLRFQASFVDRDSERRAQVDRVMVGTGLRKV